MCRPPLPPCSTRSRAWSRPLLKSEPVTAMVQPILQFGTSRFLQAHVDLFIAEALAQAPGAGDALGGITVVQTTDRADGAARIAALRQAVAQGDVKVIVSNTGDQGYGLSGQDGPALLAAGSPAPQSFPAKLLVLLHGRWQQTPNKTLTLLPCELVERNGEVLRDLVGQLARQWGLPEGLQQWLHGSPTGLVWANSLVDRIVSEAIEPVGAVAEPYAVWVIERQAGLQLPCRHPAIVLTDDLAAHERLKLFLLNAGHTFLAERWLLDQRPAAETVRQAMADAPLRAELEALWCDEILPVFQALGERPQAEAYLRDVRERFENPLLEHRIADIAQNHAAKKQRRLAPIVALAAQRVPGLVQARLQAALAPTN